MNEQAKPEIPDERGHDGLTSEERIREMTRPVPLDWKDERIAALESQLKTVLDREAETQRRHDERIAALTAENAALKENFKQHTDAVVRFLTAMYQTMVDPVEDPDPQIKVADMCELLLHAASDNRRALQDQMDRAGNLPANWKEDSSLETWFPLTAEELERTKSENAELTKQLALERSERATEAVAWKGIVAQLEQQVERLKDTAADVYVHARYSCPQWGRPDFMLELEKRLAARKQEGEPQP
jgi:hypothetical protein